MINHSAALNERALCVILTELHELRAAVPSYASWRIADLKQIAERYAFALNWFSEQHRYRRRCAGLRRTLEGIETEVAEAMASGHWRPFNRAAIALEFDLDELIELAESARATA